MAKNGENSLKSVGVSFPRGVRSQTKAKFDALLKAALKKKSSPKKTQLEFNKSSQNLMAEMENVATDETPKEHDEISVESNKNFILDKFLSDTTEAENVTTILDPPIPKPRTSKNKIRSVANDVASNSSVGTYSIVSPKIFNKSYAVQRQSSSDDTDATYVKSRNNKVNAKYASSKNSHTSSSSEHLETVGDILVHDSPSYSVLHVLDNNSPVKSDKDSTLIVEIAALEQQEHTTIITVHDSLKIQAVSDSVMYEQEIKPKPKQRTFVRGKHSKSKTEETTLENAETNTVQEKTYTYESITAVIIHKADGLELNPLVRHPLVNVHIVNSVTGEYLRKSDRNRAVTFYYENKNFDYISPVLTETFNMRKARYTL